MYVRVCLWTQRVLCTLLYYAVLLFLFGPVVSVLPAVRTVLCVDNCFVVFFGTVIAVNTAIDLL